MTQQKPSPSDLVTNGVIKACDDLDINGATVARIIGISTASVSRMRNGTWKFQEGSKSYELAIALLRMHLALKRKMRDNLDRMRGWLRATDATLGSAPIDHLNRIQGLFRVIFLLEKKEEICI